MQGEVVPPTGTATVPEAGEVLVNANTAYEAGDYARAAALYESLVERGIVNGFLYYNLGNAYLRGGELGRAIAAYRACRQLLPRDRDVVANLEFARRSARDAIEAPAPGAMARTLFFWHYGLSRGELLRATVLLEALFFALLAVRQVRRHSELLRWASILVLVLLLACGGSLLTHLLEPRAVVVVVPQEVDVHSAVDTESVVRFKLHAGTEVEVVEERPDWVRIELPDGEQGWIERRYAEVVEGV
jgi:hypothetical protein